MRIIRLFLHFLGVLLKSLQIGVSRVVAGLNYCSQKGEHLTRDQQYHRNHDIGTCFLAVCGRIEMNLISEPGCLYFGLVSVIRFCCGIGMMACMVIARNEVMYSYARISDFKTHMISYELQSISWIVGS